MSNFDGSIVAHRTTDHHIAATNIACRRMGLAGKLSFVHAHTIDLGRHNLRFARGGHIEHIDRRTKLQFANFSGVRDQGGK